MLYEKKLSHNFFAHFRRFSSSWNFERHTEIIQRVNNVKFIEKFRLDSSVWTQQTTRYTLSKNRTKQSEECIYVLNLLSLRMESHSRAFS